MPDLLAILRYFWKPRAHLSKLDTVKPMTSKGSNYKKRIHMQSKLGFLLLSIVLISCGSRNQPASAFLEDDPLNLPVAKIGETQFSCLATINQYKGVDQLPLKIQSTLKLLRLTENDRLTLQATDFANLAENEPRNIADSLNINNLKLHAFFVDEESLGCSKDESEFHVTSTTVFAHLERNVTVSSGYCWNRKALSIQTFQNIYPGAVRKAPGVRQSGIDDFDMASFDDEAATPIKYSIKCERTKFEQPTKPKRD